MGLQPAGDDPQHGGDDPQPAGGSFPSDLDDDRPPLLDLERRAGAAHRAGGADRRRRRSDLLVGPPAAGIAVGHRVRDRLSRLLGRSVGGGLRLPPHRLCRPRSVVWSVRRADQEQPLALGDGGPGASDPGEHCADVRSDRCLCHAGATSVAAWRGIARPLRRVVCERDRGHHAGHRGRAVRPLDVPGARQRAGQRAAAHRSPSHLQSGAPLQQHGQTETLGRPARRVALSPDPFAAIPGRDSHAAGTTVVVEPGALERELSLLARDRAGARLCRHRHAVPNPRPPSRPSSPDRGGRRLDCRSCRRPGPDRRRRSPAG